MKLPALIVKLPFQVVKATLLIVKLPAPDRETAVPDDDAMATWRD